MSTQSAKTTPPPAAPGASLALGFIVLCLVVYVLYVAGGIMIPFVIALFVWYLINAMARGFGRLRLGAGHVPRFLCFLLAIFCLVAGGWFIYKLISVNAVAVMAEAPNYQRKLEAFLPTLLERVPEVYRPNKAEILSYLNIGGFITVLVKTFTGVAGKTLVVLFYTGFLLYEQRFFGRKLKEMIESPRAERRVEKILKNIDLQIQRYIAVKTFVSVLTGLATWSILVFFHVDFAQFWGVMAFILNFIPYVGSLTAVLLPALIALVQYGDGSSLLAVAATLGAMQLAFGSVLEPRMMGDNLNLSPIFIIFSVAAWGMIWGVPGMFLSIPILAMIVITLAQFENTRPLAILLTKTGELEGEAPPK